MRIATVGSASALTWLPSSLMDWPHQSFRNSPSFHSLGWNTATYDADFIKLNRGERKAGFIPAVCNVLQGPTPHALTRWGFHGGRHASAAVSIDLPRAVRLLW